MMQMKYENHYQGRSPVQVQTEHIHIAGPYSDRNKQLIITDQHSTVAYTQSNTNSTSSHNPKYYSVNQQRAHDYPSQKTPQQSIINPHMFSSPGERNQQLHPQMKQGMKSHTLQNNTPNIKLKNEFQWLQDHQQPKLDQGILLTEKRTYQEVHSQSRPLKKQTLDSYKEGYPKSTLYLDYPSSSTLPTQSAFQFSQSPTTQLNKSNQSQTTAKVFNFNHEQQEQTSKTIMLIKTLCQTYQKDKVFAQSIMKLVSELNQEVINGQSGRDLVQQTEQLLGQIESLEKKKRYYKTMARTMKTDLNDFKKHVSKEALLHQALTDRDTFIRQLKSRMETLERELNNVRLQNEVQDVAFGRQSSVSTNHQFQDLVEECDKYLDHHVMEHQTFAVKEVIEDTLEKIKSSQVAYEVYQQHFQSDDQFKASNFDRILKFIQELVQKLQPQEKNCVEQVSIDSIKEMKDRLFKEITEQLDLKMCRIQQTLEQTSNISDTTMNKSQPLLSREDIHKEIMQILKEQQQQQQIMITSSSDFSNRPMTSKSSFHRNCCGTSQVNTAPNSNSKQTTSEQKKPSIRPKNLNNAILSKPPPRHDNTTSDISPHLQRNNRRGSYIMGCDGDAVIFRNETMIQESPTRKLDEKLNKAEERLMELEKTQKSDTSRRQSVKAEKPIFQTAVDTSIRFENHDDEMLLSDQERNVRKTATFGDGHPHITDQRNLIQKKAFNDSSAKKKNQLKQLLTGVSSNPDLTQEDENAMQVMGRETITPKEQQSKDFNRFGFRQREKSISKQQ